MSKNKISTELKAKVFFEEFNKIQNRILVVFIYIFLILFSYSCGNSEGQIQESKTPSEKEFQIDSILGSHNFQRDVKYEPISLIYKGESILIPGQKVEDLDSRLSFRYDPNGEFWAKTNLIMDYLSLDENLSVELEQGSANGIFFFSSDVIKHQIFSAAANWTFAVEITKTNEAQIIEQFTEKLLPILRGKLKFEENWKYEYEKKNYIEYFSLRSPESPSAYWSLYYEIKMK